MLANRLLKLLPSLSIYFVGMGAFLLSDFLVVKNITDIGVVSNWAFIKSTLILVAVVAVFGAEQSILRYPQGLKKVYKLIIGRTFILSLLISVFLSFYSPVKDFIFWLISIVGLAFTIIFYSILRTSLNMSLSQLCQNLWKIILLFLVVYSVFYGEFDAKSVYIFSIYFSILILSFFLVLLKDSWLNYYKNHTGNHVDKKTILSISNYFIVSALTLNFSANFEQLVLNFLDLKYESALFLAHTSVFFPLVLILNGVLGFYLGPYVKNNENKINSGLITKSIFIMSLVSLVLCFLSFLIGYFVFKKYYSQYEFNIFITLSLLFVGYFRMLYLIPSCLVGVIGSDKITKRYILNNFFVVVVLLVILLVSRSIDNIFYAVIIAGVINWALRALTGIYYSYVNLQKVG